MEKEQLMALLAQTRALVEKAEEQVVKQRETIRSLERQGINGFQARAILGSLEETLDFYLARMEGLLNRLDATGAPENHLDGLTRSGPTEIGPESR